MAAGVRATICGASRARSCRVSPTSRRSAPSADPAGNGAGEGHAMKDGFVRTKHGRLHYLEAGRGPAVIMLHSNDNSAYEYEDLMKPLAARHRVIAWEQPGHGDSEPITRHYRVEDYSDAVVAFMDGLGLDKASVMGSSIGGAITADLGARHGARIDKLFIVEAPARGAEEWARNWLTTEKNYSFPTQT